MYYIYILESKKDRSRYVGTTSDLWNRIKEHNSQGTKSTRSKAPYRILWYSVFADKQRAYAFERYLKSSSGFAFRNKHLI